jgi:hypothetical protein
MAVNELECTHFSHSTRRRKGSVPPPSYSHERSWRESLLWESCGSGSLAVSPAHLQHTLVSLTTLLSRGLPQLPFEPQLMPLQRAQAPPTALQSACVVAERDSARQALRLPFELQPRPPRRV